MQGFAAAKVQAGAREYPLSYGQRAIWFLYRLAPRSPAYNIICAARVRAALDPARLLRCFEALAERHASLRATFAGGNGEAVQRVRDRVEIQFEHEDASGWDETRLIQTAGERGHVPFDLENGPVMRTHLFSRSARDHVIEVVFHHIVSDLWSAAMFGHELAVLYSAETRGVAPGLRPLRAQYSDYVGAQEELLAGPEGERLWDFWRHRLAGHLPVLNLPADHPRPPFQSYDGGVHRFRLGSAPAAALRSLAAERGCTLSALCLTAWNVLLHRYSAQDDILVGFPRAGRAPRFAGVLGYFINPVVIRSDLSGNPRFSDLLARERDNIAESLEHGEYPFPLLAEKLRVTQDPSRSPLFQVAFTWQKTTRAVNQDVGSFVLYEPGGRLGNDDLPLESFPVEGRTCQFDLALQMADFDDTRRGGMASSSAGLAGALTYSTDLFDASTAARIAGHYAVLLEGIARDPNGRISSLPMLSGRERLQVLADWNPPSAADPAFEPLTAQFEAAAFRYPDSVALECGSGHIRYRDLDRRANQLGSYLRRAGIGRESIVGILTRRSPEMCISLLGILKAGAAFLPLDPELPAERLRFLCEDSGVTAIVTLENLLARVPVQPVTVVCLDRDRVAIAAQGGEKPACVADPRQLAYVIYTSGSTGKPKGVGVQLAEISQHCRNAASHYQHAPGDRFLQFASLNFDAAIEQICAPLISGATVVLRGDEIWSAREFHQTISAKDLTVVNLPPAYWEQWIEEWSRSGESLDGTRLRLVIVGGDAISAESLARWRRVAPPGLRLLNAYGPTETTITAMTCELHELAREVQRVPIGRQLGNRRAYVLDETGELLPAGVPGELWLGGALARGYLNRPEITAARFSPDPFTGEPGGRLYRTGDLVRYLADGSIEYLGRLDGQVKIRGFRIELGEVEAALGQHPAVTRAVVAVREDKPGDRRLCAYILADTWDASMPRQLRNLAKARLPDYMVPSAFVRLDHLPLTPGGKPDRQALPAPPALADAGTQYVPPRTGLEESIAAIWAEVLGRSPVGVFDNFFELGGHSLLATQVISRVRDITGAELALNAFFSDPTVSGLALAVAQTLVERVQTDEALRMIEELRRCA